MITLTESEAISLANHLEIYILQEVRDCADDYDNIDYLSNLVRVYDRCREVEKKHDLREALGVDDAVYSEEAPADSGRLPCRS